MTGINLRPSFPGTLKFGGMEDAARSPLLSDIQTHGFNLQPVTSLKELSQSILGMMKFKLLMQERTKFTINASSCIKQAASIHVCTTVQFIEQVIQREHSNKLPYLELRGGGVIQRHPGMSETQHFVCLHSLWEIPTTLR